MKGVQSSQEDVTKILGELTLPETNVDRALRTNARRPSLTRQNFWRYIKWKHILLFTIIYSLAIWAVPKTKLTRNTLLFSIAYFFMTGFAITGGYHRLWSHRSYNATLLFQYSLALLGAGASQHSIAWWSSKHRAHHRYTDTDLDPYGAHTGLFWSHFGWLLVEPRYNAPIDRSDLMKSPVVRWQHKYYIPLLLIMAFIVPTAVAGYGWNDWHGGFVYGGLVRIIILQHITSSINSLAHHFGHATFDDKHSPRDHFITAIITGGEGYHNFHHQFPMDYRNGTKWYHYDATKWAIYVFSKLRLVSHLRRFPDNEIKKAKFVMKLKTLRKEQDGIVWPMNSHDLPVVNWDIFQEESLTKPLVLIGGFIHDVSMFLDEHPGGRGLLAAQIGKDATPLFFGGIYDHSNAAHNLLATMRVGILQGGLEVLSETKLPLSEKLRIVETGHPESL